MTKIEDWAVAILETLGMFFLILAVPVLIVLTWTTPSHSAGTILNGCVTTPGLIDVGTPAVLCDASGRFIMSPIVGSPAASVQASSGNVAAATATAAIPAVALKTNYITGFQINAGGATAGACVTATVAGLLGGTLSYTYCSVTGAGLPSPPLVVAFVPPLPASAVNTAITLSVPSLGAGNTNATANIQGFVQ